MFYIFPLPLYLTWFLIKIWNMVFTSKYLASENVTLKKNMSLTDLSKLTFLLLHCNLFYIFPHLPMYANPTWLFLRFKCYLYICYFRLWKKPFRYFIFWMKSSVVKWIIYHIMHFVSIWFQNVKPTICLFANFQYMQNLQMIQNFLYLWNMKY